MATSQATPPPAGAAAAAASTPTENDRIPPRKHSHSPDLPIQYSVSSTNEHIPAIFFPSPERLAWSSDEEDDEEVPDSPAELGQHSQGRDKRPDLGALPVFPCLENQDSTEKPSLSEGQHGGPIRIKSEIVVPRLVPKAEIRCGKDTKEYRKRSYREVLLQGSFPAREFDRPKKPCPRCTDAAARPRSDNSQRILVQHAPPEDGWQLVQMRRACRRASLRQAGEGSRVDSDQLQLRRTYLAKIKGRCFNCLALDHLVAHCRDPTRCWSCWRSGHISSRCPSHRKPATSITNATTPKSALQQTFTANLVQPHPSTAARNPQFHTTSSYSQNNPAQATHTMDALNLGARPDAEHCNVPFH